MLQCSIKYINRMLPNGSGHRFSCLFRNNGEYIMMNFTDFTKFDFTAIPAAIEKSQKEMFDQSEQNLKIMTSLVEQNLAFWRAVTDNANAQSAKIAKSFKL